MANIAIIPARGGSKRLPGKNIRKLGDKPLIAWTIQAAIKSNCFDTVLVSTDDEKIAAVAKEYGAVVPFLRPAELANDTATSDTVIEHAVEWLEAHQSMTVETVSLLQPTSPFRNELHIRETFKLFNEKQADAIVSVGESDTCLELCNRLPKDHSLSGFLKTDVGRTQDMQQVYELNGAIYLFKRLLVGQLRAIYEPGCKSYAYIMNAIDSIDIDTELDFDWAEFCLSKKFKDRNEN